MSSRQPCNVWPTGHTTSATGADAGGVTTPKGERLDERACSDRAMKSPGWRARARVTISGTAGCGSALFEREPVERKQRAAESFGAQPFHLKRDLVVAGHEADKFHPVHDKAAAIVLGFDVGD